MSNYNQTPVDWLTFLESVFLESSLLLTQIWIETFSSAVFFFRVLFTNVLRIACLTLWVNSLIWEFPVFPFLTDLACVHLNKVEFDSHHALIPLAGCTVSTGHRRHLLQVWRTGVKQTPQPVRQLHVFVRWYLIDPSTLHHRRLSSSQIPPQVCSQDLNISAGYPMFCLYRVWTCSAENRCGFLAGFVLCVPG